MAKLVKKIAAVAMTVAIASLFAACGGGGGSDTPAAKPAEKAPAAAPASDMAAKPEAPAAMDASAEAEQLFQTLCITCHGTSGMGDGPAGASLDPHPANWTDPEFQAARTDDDIAKAIVEGGAGVGKSPLMPANPTLKDKPEVVMELVKRVRSFNSANKEMAPEPPAGEEGAEAPAGDDSAAAPAGDDSAAAPADDAAAEPASN